MAAIQDPGPVLGAPAHRRVLLYELGDRTVCASLLISSRVDMWIPLLLTPVVLLIVTSI